MRQAQPQFRLIRRTVVRQRGHIFLLILCIGMLGLVGCQKVNASLGAS
jgi:hypothetical protein